MTKSLVITLGNLGESLLRSATEIIGHSDVIGTYCIDWHEHVETSRKNIGDRIEQMGDADGLLLLTDIWGGTSTNIALDYREPGKVEVVTGVNLPMVVTAQRLPGKNQPARRGGALAHTKERQPLWLPVARFR